METLPSSHKITVCVSVCRSQTCIIQLRSLNFMSDFNNSATNPFMKKYRARCARCNVSWQHKRFSKCPFGKPIPMYAQPSDTPYRHVPQVNTNDRLCGGCNTTIWRKYRHLAPRSLTQQQLQRHLNYSRSVPSRPLTGMEATLASLLIRRKLNTR